MFSQVLIVVLVTVLQENQLKLHACVIYVTYHCLSDLKTTKMTADCRNMWCSVVLQCIFVILGANKFYRDQVASRDQEPWLFRGGLLGEIQVRKDYQKYRVGPGDIVADVSCSEFKVGCR